MPSLAAKNARTVEMNRPAPGGLVCGAAARLVQNAKRQDGVTTARPAATFSQASPTATTRGTSTVGAFVR